MVGPTRADRQVHREDAEEQGCRKGVEVNFYGPGSFCGLHRKPIERLSPLIHRLLLGGGPWHCNFEFEGLVYDCNTYHGCAIYRSVEYHLEPSISFRMEVDLDRSWFMQSRRFQISKTLLDLLGLIPRDVRPINCVQATAWAIGVEARCRTPRDLLEVIQRCQALAGCSSLRKSRLSPTQVKRKPTKKTRSVGRRSGGRERLSRLALQRWVRSSFKLLHSVVSEWLFGATFPASKVSIE